MTKNTHILPGVTSFLQYVVGARSDISSSSEKSVVPVKSPQPKQVTPLTKQESIGIGVHTSTNESITLDTQDRLRHTYVVGKTGMGKSSLLENMISQDIQAGRGVVLIDPHGDLYENVLAQIPKSRMNDIVLFDASDTEYPVGFNILENTNNQLDSFIASGAIGVFKKIFGHSWGPRMEYILRNALLTLIGQPDSTLLSLALLLTDDGYRKQCIRRTDNAFLKKFWEEEFHSMSQSRQAEVVSPILNKIGQFLSVPLIRNIIAQPKSSFSPRWIMDNNKIFLANLSKGKIGEDVSQMLGSLLVTKFQLDAMSRADIPSQDRTPVYMYVDEFQNFATESFTDILSESRKYGLSLTLANQHISQLSDPVAQSIFGNVATFIAFQLGYPDARSFAGAYGSGIQTDALTSLQRYQFISRSSQADGAISWARGLTLPPKSLNHVLSPERHEKMLRLTHEKFAKPRDFVEKKIVGLL